MNKRLWIIMLVCVLGVAMAVTGVALAQRSAAAHGAAQHGGVLNATPDVALGKPGVVFRYTGQLGETGVAYLADTEHLNRPGGLFVDTDDNVFVAEEYGSRALKYDSGGNNLWAIGNPGICYETESSFCSVWDMAVDLSGTVWVVDSNRVVQFDQDGNYLQMSGWGVDPDYNFYASRGVAFDSLGHMFVSDSGRHRIKVYDLSGPTPVYSTTIGHTEVPSDTIGYFNWPHRLAVDSQDRLLVADTANNRVQRCTFAAGWTCEVMDGDLNGPRGVAVDGSDAVYIADTNNSRVRKCTAPGTCVDLIPNTYGGLEDLALDTTGNIFVTYEYSDAIIKYDSAGNEIGIFAGEWNVPYLTDGAHYNHPRLAVDAQDNLLIYEEDGNRLVKLDKEGDFQWAFGVPGNGGDDNAHLNTPIAVAADAAGNAYVVTTCRVRIISADGVYSDTFGSCGDDDDQFWWMNGIAIAPNGTVYISDGEKHRVQVYAPGLVYSDTIGVTGECGSDNEHLCRPRGLALDADGNLYVADVWNNRIQKFSPGGEYLQTIGDMQGGGEFGQFNSAEMLAVDAEGRIYVADFYNNRVQVFSPEGEFLTSIGGSFGDASSQFKFASSVAVNSQGRVYVGDFLNSRIQVFEPGVPGWTQANINGFGSTFNNGAFSLEVFNDQLFATSANWGSGAQVWRMETDGSWMAVSEPGFSSTYTHTNPAIPDMVVFNGQLYADTAWSGIPGQLWRTPDGTTWEQVEDNGFDDEGSIGLTALGVFDGWLYVGTHNLDQGTEIWRSETGDPGDWERVVQDGNGNPNAYIVTSFLEFQDQLYAAVENMNDGCEIWRTDDGLDWTPASTGGFGLISNGQTGGMALFDGYLYVGTLNYETGAQVWRSANGTDWEPVVEDGFGDVNNYKIEMVFPYAGRLYAGTDNGANGEEIWESVDGLEWTQVNPDGWGDINTTGLVWNDAAVYQNKLYIGANNGSSGGKIWRYDVDHPPVAYDDSATTDEDTPLAIDVLANDEDIDGDTLLVSAVTQPPNGSVIFSDTLLTYTPSANFYGLDVFTYQVSDGELTDTASVSVTVLAVNDPPVANDDAYSTDEDTPLVVPAATGVLFNDMDAEGDDLTAILVQAPLSGTLMLEMDGSFTYTPTQDAWGVDFFMYKANDGQADSSFASVTLNIAPVNDAPLAVADVYTTTRDATLVVTAPGILDNDSDVDGDTLTATLVQDVAHGTLTLGEDGSFTYIPASGFTGIDSFTYQAYDGLAWSDVVTVTLNVSEVTYYICLPIVMRH